MLWKAKLLPDPLQSGLVGCTIIILHHNKRIKGVVLYQSVSYLLDKVKQVYKITYKSMYLTNSKHIHKHIVCTLTSLFNLSCEIRVLAQATHCYCINIPLSHCVTVFPLC